MKTKKISVIILTSILTISIVLFVAILSFGLNNRHVDSQQDILEEELTTEDPFLTGDLIDEQFLTINPYSRSGSELEQVNGIVIHYVGNPGTTAQQNRDYFESLMTTEERSASSHYVIGLQGEIIQCIPLDEISYASNQRNFDTISIECCHIDESGKFNDATYQSLVTLTAALCKTYGLDPMNDVIRHYDITGKLCPLYFVEHEDEWYGFKLNVKGAMDQ